MSPERYERELKSRDGVAVYACGRQPHDRVWAQFDEEYATAASVVEEDAILNRFRTALTSRLIQ